MRGMGGGYLASAKIVFPNDKQSRCSFCQSRGLYDLELSEHDYFSCFRSECCRGSFTPPPPPHPKLDCPPFKPNSTVPGVVVMVTPVAIHQLLSGTSYNPSQKSLATLRRKPSPASPLLNVAPMMLTFLSIFFRTCKTTLDRGYGGKRKPLSNVIV